LEGKYSQYSKNTFLNLLLLLPKNAKKKDKYVNIRLRKDRDFIKIKEHYFLQGWLGFNSENTTDDVLLFSMYKSLIMVFCTVHTGKERYMQKPHGLKSWDFYSQP